MPSLASAAFLLPRSSSSTLSFLPFLSSSFCSYLDSDPVFSLSLSSTFQHFPTRPSSVLLGAPHLCHPSISLFWIWSCVIVSASLLGWRLSKGPQDPSHTEGLQPCQRCPLSSPPCVFSPHLLSLLSAHLVPLHLSGTEGKGQICFFFFLLSAIKIRNIIEIR